MGIVFRQSIKASIVTLTGAILAAVITFLQPYVLPVEEVGLVTNIIFTGAIIQLFVSLGMASAVAYQTQKYPPDDERRKALFTMAVVITLITTSFISVGLLLFKQNILSLYKTEDRQLLSRYYHLIPTLIFIWSVMTLFEQYLIANVKIALSALAKEVILRIFNLILIALLFFEIINAEQFINATVIAYIIPLAIMYIVSARIHGFGYTFKKKLFTNKEYRGILHFAWYHLLIVVSLNVLNYIDTLLLGIYDATGMEAIGIYSRAIMIATIVYLPFRAMATASMPILNEAFLGNNMPKVRDLFTRAGINILVAGIGMFVIMAMNLDNAVKILPKGYEEVKPLVLILMAGKLVDMATGLNNELISISKYYKFNFRAAAFLLAMVIILDRIFIPQYGMYAAAWVATFSLAAFNIIKLIFLYIKMKLHPFNKNTFLILIAGLVAVIPGYFMPDLQNPFIDTIIRSIIIIITYVIMLIWLKPSPDFNQYLQQVRQNKKLF